MIAAEELEVVGETERLRLEPLVVAHAAELFGALAEPGLYLYIPREPPGSVAAVRARLERLVGRRSPDGAELWLNWVMRAEGAPVGMLEATVQPDRTAWVAYTVFAAAQRRGYATEAVRWLLGWLREALGVERALATVDPRNAASVALLGRLGFALEATYPADEPVGGAPATEQRFGLELGPRGVSRPG